MSNPINDEAFQLKIADAMFEKHIPMIEGGQRVCKYSVFKRFQRTLLLSKSDKRCALAESCPDLQLKLANMPRNTKWLL